MRHPPRPQSAKLRRLLAPAPVSATGTIADAVRDDVQAASDPALVPVSIAVVIPCHNYGRFLADCLRSVLAQTRPADEILVVDDASTDDTRAVAAEFSARGVRYLRINAGHVHAARGAGFVATTSAAVCFLDADDVLPADYLAAGLPCFGHGPDVGIVYSDWETFGERVQRRTFPEFDATSAAALERENFLHAGALVRRTALDESRALAVELPDAAQAHADWWFWRQVVRCGWSAVKQAAVYRYRKHGGSMSDRGQRDARRKGLKYYDHAALACERLTLCVPLAGRDERLPGLLDFLRRQTWPHARTDLILLDTSQDPGFRARLTAGVAALDYPSPQIVSAAVGRRKLADADRRRTSVVADVRAAVCRVYRLLQALAPPRNEYVWILEDDVLPRRPDVAERLLRRFAADVASVAAPYRSRYHDGYTAKNREGRILTAPGPAGTAVDVQSHGWGCTLVRRSILQQAAFTEAGDADLEFCRQVPRGLRCLLDWDCEADHLDAAAGTSTARP